MRDCNPKITMKENPSDKVCIPMELDANEKFPDKELCKDAVSVSYWTVFQS